MRTIELTNQVRQSIRKPIGYLVFNRGGENHYFEDKTEAMNFANAVLYDEDEFHTDQWEVYPLYASHPRIVK